MSEDNKSVHIRRSLTPKKFKRKSEEGLDMRDTSGCSPGSRTGQKGKKVRKLPDVENFPGIENKSLNHNRRASSESDFTTSTPRYPRARDMQCKLLEENISISLSNNDKVSPKPRRICPLTPNSNRANRSLDDPTEWSQSGGDPPRVNLAINSSTPFTVVSSTRAEKSYECNLCYKNFKYFSNIKSHLQVVHKRAVSTPESRDRHYSDTCENHVIQCEVCLRHFKYATNLRAHRLVHSCVDYSPA